LKNKFWPLFFGTGYEADGILSDFSVMKSFCDFWRGLLTPSYLPTVMGYRAQVGEAKSWEFTAR
jgi:hypothetical protein